MSSGPRVVIPVSGVTDSNGNATISTPAITQWSTLTVYAKLATGNGTWTVYGSGSNTNPTNPFGNAQGNSVVAGPFDLAPQEFFVLSVTGAPTNTPITGTVFGVQNVDPNNLDANTMVGNVGAVSATISGTVTTQTPQSSGPSFTLAPGTSQNVDYTIPPGTSAIALSIFGSGGNKLDTLTVQGTSTLFNYLYRPGYVLPVAVNNLDFNLTGGSTDTQVLIGASANAGNSGSVTIQPFFLPPGIIVSPPTLADNLYAPFSVAMVSTGLTHVIPAPFGLLVVRLQQILFDVSLAGAGAGTWQDTAGNHIGFSTLQNGAPRFLDMKDTPLPGGVGVGLDFNVTAALASSFMVGTVIYKLGIPT